MVVAELGDALIVRLNSFSDSIVAPLKPVISVRSLFPAKETALANETPINTSIDAMPVF